MTANQEVKPNAETTISVETEKGSQVFLTAIDSTSALLKSNFEISRTDIYNELVHYINKKFPGVSRYHFEKLNAYILEPLINGKDCKSDLSSRTSIESDNDEEVTDNGVHQYFPKISDDLNFNSTTSNVQNKQMKVPNSLSTLKLFAISVHKTKGFTVAKNQPEITVKNEVLIQIEAPSLIRTNEILRARATVFNFQNSPKNGKIIINIENGIFNKQENHQTKENCLVFKNEPEDSLTFNKNFPADGTPLTIDFLVSTNQFNLPIKIKAKVTANAFTHETEKEIEVFGFRLLGKTISKSYFIESQGRNQFEGNISKDKDKDLYITLHGNLLGPALHGLEAIL